MWRGCCFLRYISAPSPYILKIRTGNLAYVKSPWLFCLCVWSRVRVWENVSVWANLLDVSWYLWKVRILILKTNLTWFISGKAGSSKQQWILQSFHRESTEKMQTGKRNVKIRLSKYVLPLEEKNYLTSTINEALLFFLLFRFDRYLLLKTIFVI